MAWQDISVVLLRHAINDVDCPTRYSDSRLNLAWLVGGQYVTNEVSLINNYKIDLISVDINPDPTIGATIPGSQADQWAVNLITARSAIIMITNDLKLASNSAWRIQDVHMRADLTEMYKANKVILDEMKELYENAKLQYGMGVNPQAAAILTPINVLAAGYRAPLYGYDTRDRLIF